jgi:uncharacterized membrane protein YobD (UPF0266 family)
MNVLYIKKQTALSMFFVLVLTRMMTLILLSSNIIYTRGEDIIFEQLSLFFIHMFRKHSKQKIYNMLYHYIFLIEFRIEVYFCILLYFT